VSISEVEESLADDPQLKLSKIERERDTLMTRRRAIRAAFPELHDQDEDDQDEDDQDEDEKGSLFAVTASSIAPSGSGLCEDVGKRLTELLAVNVLDARGALHAAVLPCGHRSSPIRAVVSVHLFSHLRQEIVFCPGIQLRSIDFPEFAHDGERTWLLELCLS